MSPERVKELDKMLTGDFEPVPSLGAGGADGDYPQCQHDLTYGSASAWS
jgi:hypothetical protein